MRRLLIIAALWFAAFPAYAQFNPMVQGPAAASSYTGIGDLATWSVAYGTRAYSAATAGNNAIDVVCASVTYTIKTLANGDLDNATLSSDCGANTPTVRRFYCQVPACTNDFLQATVAQQATLVTSAFNGKTCAKFTATTNYTSTATINLAQPFTHSFVYEVTARPSISENLLGDNNGAAGADTYLTTSAGIIALYAGVSPAGVSAADNALHEFQAVYNNTSSTTKIDSAAPASYSSPGTQAFGGGTTMISGLSASGGTVYMCEFSVAPSGLSSTVQGNVQANQSAYW